MGGVSGVGGSMASLTKVMVGAAATDSVEMVKKLVQVGAAQQTQQQTQAVNHAILDAYA